MSVPLPLAAAAAFALASFAAGLLAGFVPAFHEALARRPFDPGVVKAVKVGSRVLEAAAKAAVAVWLIHRAGDFAAWDLLGVCLIDFAFDRALGRLLGMAATVEGVRNDLLVNLVAVAAGALLA